MHFRDKHYLHEIEESIERYEGLQVEEHGNYVSVRWWEHATYIYKIVESGEHIHPYTPHIEHNGNIYQLAYIEDEKEHATSFGRA